MADLKEYWNNSQKWVRVCFWVLLFIGVGFLIASFVLPPLGIIDSSVLAAFGEIQGFASIGMGFEAIREGMNVKLAKGNTNIEITHNQTK